MEASNVSEHIRNVSARIGSAVLIEGCSLLRSVDRCVQVNTAVQQKPKNVVTSATLAKKTFRKKSPGAPKKPEHPLRSPTDNQTERVWGQIISATITLRGAQREKALVSTIQLPSSPSNKQTLTALCQPLRRRLLLLHHLLFLPLMLPRNRQLALNQPNIIPPPSSFPGRLARGGDGSAEQRSRSRFRAP